jgi:hypothetical protein
MGCHLALGWPLPVNVLDLFAEFRTATNGLSPPCGAGLVGALTWHGLDAMDVSEKDSMRLLAQRGGGWSAGERKMLLDYCESDVEALQRLLAAMAPELDLPRALLRGRYMKAAAVMEHNGIPMDTATLQRFQRNWPTIQDQVIAGIDRDYRVYEGRTFKQDRFASYLVEHQIPWPRLDSGRLDLKDDTFREMALVYPQIAALRELRVSLAQMRNLQLSVGVDGRNRCLLSAFRAKTGRNQPSTTQFAFGPSAWLRGLIQPRPGNGIAYIDWSQQEFGIAAALSADGLMREAYLSGDPYLAFAKQAGAVPESATKQTHKVERDQFKACVLAVQYGMGAESLARRINQPVSQARSLLQLHRETYRSFWAWSDAAVNYSMLHGRLWTVFGWTLRTGPNANPRSLCNFPMQANGAEMLRLACCMLVEDGIKVCAPVHDAVLIEAPLEHLDEVVARTKAIMAGASSVVLDGFRLRSDAEIFRHPDRYSDPRGEHMWETVMGILGGP